MKLRRAWGEVAPVASDLVAHFESQGLLVEVGGSFRRQATTVGDLDIVVQANSLSDVVLPEQVFFERLGEQASHGIIALNGDALGVDIWCATPSQWGAFLWYITGSKELNVLMRQKAKAQGLKLSQFGLFCDDTQIDDGTERGVADALGFDWLEPTDRQKFVRQQLIADAIYQVASSSSDKTYCVTVTGSSWSCSCPHNTYRKVECKHIKQILHTSSVAA
jgi:DNA polymerase (family 10)